MRKTFGDTISHYCYLLQKQAQADPGEDKMCSTDQRVVGYTLHKILGFGSVRSGLIKLGVIELVPVERSHYWTRRYAKRKKLGRDSQVIRLVRPDLLIEWVKDPPVNTVIEWQIYVGTHQRRTVACAAEDLLKAIERSDDPVQAIAEAEDILGAGFRKYLVPAS